MVDDKIYEVVLNTESSSIGGSSSTNKQLSSFQHSDEINGRNQSGRGSDSSNSFQTPLRRQP